MSYKTNRDRQKACDRYIYVSWLHVLKIKEIIYFYTICELNKTMIKIFILYRKKFYKTNNQKIDLVNYKERLRFTNF